MAKFDPELWVHMLKLGGTYLQQGINNFEDWSAKLTEEIGEKSNPWVPAAWETLKTFPTNTHFNDRQIGVIAEKIGRVYSDGITKLSDIKSEILKMLGGNQNLVNQLESLIEAQYNGIKKYVDDLERKSPNDVKILRWKVEGKTLTVGGLREIKNYSYDKIPWRENLNLIQKIIIEEGVEKISANAFLDCRRLELLTIPASVKTIGDTAFTICYCGNILANGGKNVFWGLEDGVLILKKNPAAKSDSDFSTGSVSWLAVEKNITGFKLEPGVVPKEKFFEWLSKRGNAMQVSFA